MIHLALTIAAFLFLCVCGVVALFLGFAVVVGIVKTGNAAVHGTGDAIASLGTEFRGQPRWKRIWVYALCLVAVALLVVFLLAATGVIS